jgi:hypothetical protein
MKYKATRNVNVNGAHVAAGSEIEIADKYTAELLVASRDVVPVVVREKAVKKVAKKETANRK